MITLKVLGSLDLRDRNGSAVTPVLSQPQLSALLVYLASATPGTFHRRDTLTGLLWPEVPDKQARHNLRQQLYALRRWLGEDVPASRGREEVGVAARALSFDVRDFTLAVEDGRWEDALTLYRGAFLDGFYLSHAPRLARWIDEQRERLRQMALEAAFALSAEAIESGDLNSAGRWARKAQEISSDSERALRKLLEVLIAQGDRPGAVRAYQSFERALQADFGMAPSVETNELIALVLQQDPASGRDPGNPDLSAQRESDDADAVSRERHLQSGLPHRHLGATLAGVGAAFLGFAAVAWVLISSPVWTDAVAVDVEDATRIVAVAPVVVTGSVPAEYGDLAGELTEGLMARLIRTPGVVAIPIEGTQPAGGDGSGPTGAGRVLEADIVVEGTLQWLSGSIETTARATELSSGDVLWSLSHRHRHEELLSARRDITVGAPAAMTQDRAAGLRTSGFASEEDVAPWEFVDRAQAVLGPSWRRVSETAVKEVQELVDRAIASAPDYPPAHAARARIFRERLRHEPTRIELIDSAVATAEYAVLLGPDDPMAPQVLSMALRDASIWAPASQRPELRRRRFEAALRAVQLDPSDPGVVGLLADEIWGIGRAFLWRQRRHVLDRAFTQLTGDRAHTQWILGDFEAALATHAQWSELDPENHPPGGPREAEIHLIMGHLGQARVVVDHVLVNHPQTMIYSTAVYLELLEEDYFSAEQLLDRLLGAEPPVNGISSSNFVTQVVLAYVYLKTDRIDEGRELLEDFLLRALARPGVHNGGYGAYLVPYTLAQVYSMLGDTDEAVRWMAQGVRDGWPWYYTAMGPDDPLLENVRDDPRFVALMDEVKERLDQDREWVREMMALPEPERLDAMMIDAEAYLRGMWENGWQVGGR